MTVLEEHYVQAKIFLQKKKSITNTTLDEQSDTFQKAKTNILVYSRDKTERDRQPYLPSVPNQTSGKK